MKKLTAFMLFSVSLNSFAQSAHPFVESNAWWYVADTYPQGSQENPGFTETTTRTFSFAGDSLIGTDLWQALISTAAPDNGGSPLLEGLVRQVGDVVLLDVEGGVPFQLYDFSIGNGDSALFHISDYNDWLHVAEVDSVFVGGTFRKRILFEEYLGNLPLQLQEQWIEGLGSIHGPLFPAQARCFSLEVPGDSLLLTCYGIGEDLLWSNPSYQDCEVNIVLEVMKPDKWDEGMHLVPMPVVGLWTIHLPNIGKWQINLCSTNGQQVGSWNTIGSTIQIDLSDKASGLYLLRAMDAKGKLYAGKIIQP